MFLVKFVSPKFIILDKLTNIITQVTSGPNINAPYLIGFSSTTGLVVWGHEFTEFTIEPNIGYQIRANGIVADDGTVVLSITMEGNNVQRLRTAISGSSGVTIWSKYNTYPRYEGYFIESFALFSHNSNLLAVASNNVISLVTIDSNTLLQNMTIQQLDQYTLSTVGEKILFFVGDRSDFRLLYMVNSTSFSEPLVPLTLRGHLEVPIITFDSLIALNYSLYGFNSIVKLRRTQCTPFPVPSNNTSPVVIPTPLPNYSSPTFWSVLVFVLLLVLLIVLSVVWVGCCVRWRKASSEKVSLLYGKSSSSSKRKIIMANAVCILLYVALLFVFILCYLIIPVHLLMQPFGISMNGVTSEGSYNIGSQIPITVVTDGQESSSYEIECVLNSSGNLTLFPSSLSLSYSVPSSSSQITVFAACQYSYLSWFSDFLLVVPAQICKLFSDGACEAETVTQSEYFNTYLMHSAAIALPGNVTYTFSNDTGVGELVLNSKIESVNFGSVLLHPAFLLKVIDVISICETETKVTVEQATIPQAFLELHATSSGQGSPDSQKKIMEEGDLSIKIDKKDYTIPLDSTAYATFDINESITCVPSIQFQLQNEGAAMTFSVTCPFEFTISALVEIQTKIAVKKTVVLGEYPIPFPLPILGPATAGRIEISVEVEVKVAASVAISMDSSVSLSGTAQASLQLPNGGLSDSFNVNPIQTSFTQDGEICDGTADISLSFLKIGYFPLVENFIFNPSVSLALARHLWFDALTPAPDKQIHNLTFVACPCQDDELCPSLIAWSEGGTLTLVGEMEFFGFITANLVDRDLKTFDQKILSQSCGMLPCSPHYICNKQSSVSPPFCQPSNDTNAVYYSQCRDTCKMRYSCDNTVYRCVENVNGTYSTIEQCSSNCKKPPWYGCPCGTGTICCACPNAPYPCTGACFLSNECYPNGKDCCSGLH